MKLLIKGGRIIDPANNIDDIGDVLIEEGEIKQVGTQIKAKDAEVFDAEGLLVCPGFIDMHVHLREPGFEYKETIASGVRAAAVGGFTTIACMPNTNPVCDNAAVAEYIIKRSAQLGLSQVLPIGAISKGQKGEEISEMGELAAAGCVGFSDDGKPVMNAAVMRYALEYSLAVNLPIIAHCEDLNLAREGVMHEGFYSTCYGMKAIPAAAEEVMVARDLILAEMTGARLHIAHISTAGSVEMVRAAKKRGVKVTCEVTPHHLTLTDQAVGGYDPVTKVNPPLRSREHVDALIAGLKDGTIDCIASDHAPHELEAKDCEYDLAAFGISGLETSIPVVFNYLINTGAVDLINVVKAWTTGPAAILGLDQGTLSPGAKADLTLIDLNRVGVVDTVRFESQGKNNLYQGQELKGWPVATIIGGKIVTRNGHII